LWRDSGRGIRDDPSLIHTSHECPQQRVIQVIQKDLSRSHTRFTDGNEYRQNPCLSVVKASTNDKWVSVHVQLRSPSIWKRYHGEFKLHKARNSESLRKLLLDSLHFPMVFLCFSHLCLDPTPAAVSPNEAREALAGSAAPAPAEPSCAAESASLGLATDV